MWSSACFSKASRKTSGAEIARRFIELVGLKGSEQKYPHHLSGGMRQRAAVARAMANNPKILLMDEPFAAVDAMTRQRLQEELTAISASERTTVLFVTHAIEEAVFLSDRVVVLSGRPGRVIADMKIELDRPRRWDELAGKRRFNDYRERLTRPALWRQCSCGDVVMTASAPSSRLRLRAWWLAWLIKEIVPFAVGVLIWQALSSLDIWPSVLFPSPLQVFRAFVTDLASRRVAEQPRRQPRQPVLGLLCRCCNSASARLFDGASQRQP